MIVIGSVTQRASKALIWAGNSEVLQEDSEITSTAKRKDSGLRGFELTLLLEV